MKPYYEEPNVMIYCGDVREVLTSMESESVQCVVTSPPYWGLRDYGLEPQVWPALSRGHHDGREQVEGEGGDPVCEHDWITEKIERENRLGLGLKDSPASTRGGGHKIATVGWQRFERGSCLKCGAWSGSLGLEPTPEFYIQHLVEIFREVRRVLRRDGTLWLNLGDSYASGKGSCFNPGGGENSLEGHARLKEKGAYIKNRSNISDLEMMGLKPKDLCMIPSRVALALQSDGWWLRSDTIWSKPNPMPESVTDRPTRSHEYLFLFAKGQWKTRVVKLANLHGERFHFFKDFGLSPSKSAGALSPSGINHSPIVELCVRLASSIFDFTQSQQDFCLPPFYSEIWQKHSNGGDSDFVSSLPIPHRAAALASRFLMANTTTKEFLCELNSLRITLSDGNDFLVGRIPAKFFNTPSLYGDGKGTITVHHSGQICKVDFIHNQIIVQSPTKCKYFYDAETIKEPGVYCERGVGWRGTDNKHTAIECSIPDDDGQKTKRVRFIGDASRSCSFARVTSTKGKPGEAPQHRPDRENIDYRGRRNRRSVWSIATQPYKDAHFATFPEKLVEPCILAGSKAGDIVLDPFAGSGVTGVVAKKFGRRAILIDLKREYCDMAIKRLPKQERLTI